MLTQRHRRAVTIVAAVGVVIGLVAIGVMVTSRTITLSPVQSDGAGCRQGGVRAGHSGTLCPQTTPKQSGSPAYASATGLKAAPQGATPVAICGNSSILTSPYRGAPKGAIVVPAGNDSIAAGHYLPLTDNWNVKPDRILLVRTWSSHLRDGRVQLDRATARRYVHRCSRGRPVRSGRQPEPVRRQVRGRHHQVPHDRELCPGRRSRRGQP